MVEHCQQRVWIKIANQSLTCCMDLLIPLLGFYKPPLAKINTNLRSPVAFSVSGCSSLSTFSHPSNAQKGNFSASLYPPCLPSTIARLWMLSNVSSASKIYAMLTQSSHAFPNKENKETLRYSYITLYQSKGNDFYNSCLQPQHLRLPAKLEILVYTTTQPTSSFP
jgi:hypothetical protein